MLSVGLIFWIIFIVGFIFSGYNGRDDAGNWVKGSLLFWVLIFLLGVGTFGFPIK